MNLAHYCGHEKLYKYVIFLNVWNSSKNGLICNWNWMRAFVIELRRFVFSTAVEYLTGWRVYATLENRRYPSGASVVSSGTLGINLLLRTNLYVIGWRSNDVHVCKG